MSTSEQTGQLRAAARNTVNTVVRSPPKPARHSQQDELEEKAPERPRMETVTPVLLLFYL